MSAYACYLFDRHAEDDYLYSINYLHHGAPKTWYGVPGAKCQDLEAVMRRTVPALFDQEPDLIVKLVTMISPRLLMANKVPVYHLLQEPGNFIITFPRAFHAGFSHGFNCAEAVNFATDDWLQYGREARLKYKKMKKKRR